MLSVFWQRRTIGLDFKRKITEIAKKKSVSVFQIIIKDSNSKYELDIHKIWGPTD